MLRLVFHSKCQPPPQRWSNGRSINQIPNVKNHKSNSYNYLWPMLPVSWSLAHFILISSSSSVRCKPVLPLHDSRNVQYQETCSFPTVNHGHLKLAKSKANYIVSRWLYKSFMSIRASVLITHIIRLIIGLTTRFDFLFPLSLYLLTLIYSFYLVARVEVDSCMRTHSFTSCLSSSQRQEQHVSRFIAYYCTTSVWVY